MQAEKHPSAPVASQSIRLNITAPVTAIQLGHLKLDPVAQLLGRPIAEILEPLMTGPSYRRPSVRGPAVDVFPVALPEGEGVSVQVGALGELGFANRRGLLVLTVPLPLAPIVHSRLGLAVVEGPNMVRAINGTARVAELCVAIRGGMRAAVPLGLLGELGVEGG